MGYSTEFHLKKELDPMFKSKYFKTLKETDINTQECILVAHCMNEDSRESSKYEETIFRIEYALRKYIMLLEEKWKQDFIGKGDNTDEKFYFYGWEYSRNQRDNFAWEDTEDITNFYLRELFLLAILKTEDPFDNDTNYYEKQDKIFEILADLPYNIECLWNHKFIDRYRDNDDAIEDGDDTPKENQKAEE